MAKKFKPISFSTTMRNPYRMGEFLRVIQEFENKILTDDICIEIEKKLILEGVYQPMNKGPNIKQKYREGIELTQEEVEQMVMANPQNHKEAGFAKGWPSRFDTHYKLIKEFGFIYYNPNERILISPIAKQINSGEIDILNALSNSMKKYWSDNPYRKGTLNHVNPLKAALEALKILKKLNHEQIFALLCIPNMEVKKYIDTIKNPTQVKIEDMWGGQKFNKNAYARRKESVDDFIRKVFPTSWIKHISKPCRYIEINDSKIEEINSFLINEENFFKDQKAYFEFMGSRIEEEKVDIKSQKESLYDFWDKKLSLKDVERLLNGSVKKKSKIHIPELEYVWKPVLFELAVALFIGKNNKEGQILLNLNFDDNMVPTSPAPGGKSDITFLLNQEKVNIEVTLLKGASQHKAESSSTLRHARGDKANKLLFIAPEISEDLASNYQFEQFRMQSSLSLAAISVEFLTNNFKKNFIDAFENANYFIQENIKFQGRDLLKEIN